MFKFLVFFAALAFVQAKPYYPYPYAAPIVTYPGYPATFIGATGVPLDTPEVSAAKALHFTAKSLAAHGIAKRDVVTPIAYSAYSAPLVTTYPKPLTYSAPIVHGVVAPASTYTVHPW